MIPRTLEEFAQELRRKGDYREAEFADEILALLDIETEVAEPYSTLCDDLEHYAPNHKGNPGRALEWVGDRSNLLGEIEEQLKEAKRDGDADDAVKELLDEREDAELILRASGWAEGDFLDGLQALADRADKAPPAMEYDL